MIHFVSGKGGVGKSLAAASYAQALAQQGKRTLVVELGGSRFFEFVYGEELGFEPKEIEKNLSFCVWDGESCLREYLQYLLKFTKVVDLFFDNRIMQALVHGAPGLKELALTGKITSRERKIGPELPYDDLVIDAYSTGHFKALLAAPLAMAKAISIGPMGAQSRGIHEVLSSPQVEYLVTLNPEELPLTEGLELAQHLEKEFSQKPKFIKNKWWPDPSTTNLNDVPEAFRSKWQEIWKIQNEFDLSDYETKATLPMIWSHRNKEKIKKLSQHWGTSR